jgi:cellulose synthase/poly-beta-1,6-N-acetylglucosamine synthase-like glycosyltransferase
MEIIFCIFCGISIWYFVNIIWLILGFSKVETFKNQNLQPKTKFSIIVPFRNEAENLPKLLQSISQLNYSIHLFEVILVDDDSESKFKIQNSKFKIQIIKNFRITKSPKKDAINTAIAVAKNDWIITTDADCLVPENWLTTFDAFIQKNNPKMLAAGVSYIGGNSFLDAFQTLDFLSLQGVTIGSFGNNQSFMCNGANFCYQKSFFKELNGFIGNDNIASGDDVFLLQKALKLDHKNVHFIKFSSSIVITKTEKTWKNLFNQRVRWASKTANYSSFYSKQLGLSVLGMNLFLIIGFGFCFLDLCSWFLNFFMLFILILKFILDFILIFKTAHFFKINLKYYLLSSFIYPFFSVSVALYSFFGTYSWKGRRF